MDWIEISLAVSDENAAERAALFLRENGLRGCWMDDSEVKAYLPDEAQSWQLAETLEGKLSTLCESTLLAIGKPLIRGRRDEEWAESWKKFFKVKKVGRVVIRPSWESYEPCADEIVLDLDPGMAFGTGAHPTTEMCLALVEEHLFPGCCVLDIGTGSGILSILALKMGAQEVYAFDTDPVAVESACRNARENNVQERMHISIGSASDYRGRPTDLCVANITADVLEKILPDIAGIVKDEGYVILSGITLFNQTRMDRAAEAVGMVIMERIISGEWVSLLLRRERG